MEGKGRCGEEDRGDSERRIEVVARGRGWVYGDVRSESRMGGGT